MPPVRTFQSPVAKPAQVSKPSDDVWGSIDTIRMLLYGQSGTGKTTLWSTFDGPILCLLCSGGNKPGELRSINTAEMRKKITPKIILTDEDFNREIKEAGNYATVVLDHISGYADMILSRILGKAVPVQKGWGMATQQQYGQQALFVKEALRTMLNLPGNVVIVAQERTHGGKEDATTSSDEILKPVVGADVSASVVRWLNPACDYVVQTFKRPKMGFSEVRVNGKTEKIPERLKGTEYCLRCEPHETYTTKFRIPRGSKNLPDVIVDPTFAKIKALIDGNG